MKCYRHGRLCRRVKVEPSMISSWILPQKKKPNSLLLIWIGVMWTKISLNGVLQLRKIQPQKTVAVLKGRRWVADYEDGLQKIYYKENIIATIYAMADWFSPADIEAPTLEYVCFHNRKDYKLMKISEIPPVIFSEVMRDVDLAVSVAHAGSVDPETSHSTIEMRSMLVELTMPLFHFKNVTIKGSFAHIEGKLGKYNIHLGSGVIHQEGGAQIAVLPVHSQNRGRLFLPFVDEDPKTAEILTKIIFFAEDDKIKDPSILNQIK